MTGLFLLATSLVAVARSSILLSMYQVNPTKRLESVSPLHDVPSPMRCFDLSLDNGTEEEPSGSLVEGSGSGVLNEEDLLPKLTAKGPLKSLLRLPINVSFKHHTNEPLQFYMEHVFTLARIEQGYVWTADATTSDFEHVYDNDPLSIVLQTPASALTMEVHDQDALHLYHVPQYCQAMLSDSVCRSQRIAAFLPRSTEQIAECLDIFFNNLFRYHSFVHPLLDREINVTGLANACMSELLRFGEETLRLVSCFHSSRSMVEKIDVPLADDDKLKPFANKTAAAAAALAPPLSLIDHRVIALVPLALLLFN